VNILWNKKKSYLTYRNYSEINFKRHIQTGNFINEFLNYKNFFSNKKIIEFGPGQYSFSLISKHLGALVSCVEIHDVHHELGMSFGFKMYKENFSDLTFLDNKKFDGLWFKGSFNSCRFNDKELRIYIHKLTEIIDLNGWGVVIPRNKIVHNKQNLNYHIALQKKLFEEYGWYTIKINKKLKKKFGLGFNGCEFVFIKK